MEVRALGPTLAAALYPLTRRLQLFRAPDQALRTVSAGLLVSASAPAAARELSAAADARRCCRAPGCGEALDKPYNLRARCDRPAAV